MKLLPTFLTLFVSFNLFGQTNSNANALVPPKVHEKFLLEFPEADAKWKVDKGFFTAQFINPVNNRGYMMVYDKDANVVSREKELENNDYPAPINDYFIQKYPGEGYVVWSRIDSAGKQMFYSNHKSGLLLFNDQGALISDSNKHTKQLNYLRYWVNQ